MAKKDILVVEDEEDESLGEELVQKYISKNIKI
mgnify:CR=1 FL=1